MRKEAMVKAYLKQPLESTAFCHMSELSGREVYPSIGNSKIKAKYKYTAIKHRNNGVLPPYVSPRVSCEFADLSSSDSLRESD